jgi:hypothetical protein
LVASTTIGSRARVRHPKPPPTWIAIFHLDVAPRTALAARSTLWKLKLDLMPFRNDMINIPSRRSQHAFVVLIPRQDLQRAANPDALKGTTDAPLIRRNSGSTRIRTGEIRTGHEWRRRDRDDAERGRERVRERAELCTNIVLFLSIQILNNVMSR